MVDKFKIFVAEEISKVFSDSDHEMDQECGNYVGFLQKVRGIRMEKLFRSHGI